MHKQRAVRGWLAAERRSAAASIQAPARGALARAHRASQDARGAGQALARGALCRQRLDAAADAATAIQAAVRGPRRDGTAG